MSASLVNTVVAAAMVLGLSQAWANDAPAKEKTPQQNRMAQCNQDARTKELKGDERKAFMKQCLSNKPMAAADKPSSAQQGKMKACSEQAKGKKGEERKSFMAECLKA